MKQRSPISSDVTCTLTGTDGPPSATIPQRAPLRSPGLGWAASSLAPLSWNASKPLPTPQQETPKADRHGLNLAPFQCKRASLLYRVLSPQEWWVPSGAPHSRDSFKAATRVHCLPRMVTQRHCHPPNQPLPSSPDLPMRWRYVSASFGKSKFITTFTAWMSIPRVNKSERQTTLLSTSGLSHKQSLWHTSGRPGPSPGPVLS